MIVTCLCCGQPIKAAYQERLFKAPLLLFPCKEPGCDLRHATMDVERSSDYQKHAREFLEKDQPRQLRLMEVK